jgi:hypothetical protein
MWALFCRHGVEPLSLVLGTRAFAKQAIQRTLIYNSIKGLLYPFFPKNGIDLHHWMHVWASEIFKDFLIEGHVPGKYLFEHSILAGGSVLKAVTSVLRAIVNSCETWTLLNPEFPENEEAWKESDLDIFSTAYDLADLWLCHLVKKTFSVIDKSPIRPENDFHHTFKKKVCNVGDNYSPMQDIITRCITTMLTHPPRVKRYMPGRRLHVDIISVWSSEEMHDSYNMTDQNQNLHVLRRYVQESFDLSCCKLFFHKGRIHYVGEVPFLDNFRGRGRINIVSKRNSVPHNLYEQYNRMADNLERREYFWKCGVYQPLYSKECKRYHKYAKRGFFVSNGEEFRQAMLDTVCFNDTFGNIRGRIQYKDGSWDTENVYEGTSKLDNGKDVRYGVRVHIKEHGFSPEATFSIQYSPCQLLANHQDYTYYEDSMRLCPWSGFHLIVTRPR